MKKKIIISIISVIVLAILGGGLYGYTMLNKVKRQAIPQSDEELGISKSAETPQIQNSGVVNIALFGLDARDPSQSSNSDTIMVVSINKKNQTVKVSSLMRDMYVPIPGYENDKINAAYLLGGPALAVKTINSNFGLNIRQYITVNFFGLEKIIDELGGVQIDVSSAEAPVLNNYLHELNKLNGDTVPDVKPGLQVLNGRQAVAYSRIRYVGNGDFQRTQRQRNVLNLLFQKIKADGIFKIPGLINTMLPYVQTNLSNGDILSLANSVMKFNTDNIQQYRLPVDGLYTNQVIRGMDCLVPDIPANAQKLHDFIYGTANSTSSK